MVGIRHALRSLARAPGFTTTVLLTLALGIGANTAMFCAMDRLLLRPLPYPEPDRLVALYETQTGKGLRPVSLPNLLDWTTQSTAFDSMAGFMRRSFGLRGGKGDQGSPVSVVQVGMVTTEFFRVLRKEPAIGRSWSEAEARQPSAAPPIVLTESLWSRQFGRDPNLIGRTVELNEQPRTLMGVLPADFEFTMQGASIEAFIPISYLDYNDRGTRPLLAIGRLKPDVTPDFARNQLRTIGTRLAQAWPEQNHDGGADLETLDEAWKSAGRRPLVLLLSAALLLLAIACTNVMNLMLARAFAHRREVAIRASLGAGFSHLLRQSLAESLVLSLAGGLLGLVVAKTCLRLLPELLARVGGSKIFENRSPVDWSLNGAALTFALSMCVLVSLACGLAPAILARTFSLNPVLQDIWSGGTPRPARLFHWRRGSVVAQVAMSLVLLLSAGLFLRVFVNLVTRHPGFNSSQVYFFGFGLPEARYSDRQTIEFHRALKAKLQEIPGVETAGAVWRLPLNGRNLTTSFQFEGAGLRSTDWSFAAVNIVDPGYFPALKIPLLAGRNFSWELDRADRPRVLLVNRAFERMYGAGGRLLGRRIEIRWHGDLDAPGQRWEIAGVTEDTHQRSLDQPIRPQIYLPVSQVGLDGGGYVIRSARNDPGLPQEIAAAVRSVDSNLERIRVRRLDDWVSDSLGDRRVSAQLTAAFALVALLLTAVGLYGVVSFQVEQRRQEIAIRMALGADRGRVARLIVGQGLRLVLLGSGFGMLAFLASSRLLESQLYEVTPGDPVTIIAVALILLVCGVLACWIPARSAMRVEPMRLLR